MTAGQTAPAGWDWPGGAPVLELDQVTKQYPGSPPVRALAGVSLAVTAGELVAVAGPSGSGKSTLLHLIGTLDKPTAGTVRITGLDAAAMTDRELSALRAARIGFVFQQFFLAEHQTVLGNVADGLLYAGIRRDVQAGDAHRSCGGLVQRADQVQQCGLARPGRAGHRHQLPCGHRKAHPGQRPHRR